MEGAQFKLIETNSLNEWIRSLDHGFILGECVVIVI